MRHLPLRRFAPYVMVGVPLTLGAIATVGTPARAQQPLSYSFIGLDNTGLTTSEAHGAIGGYAVGLGNGTATGNQNNAFAWNLSTNTRTTLDNTGLTSSDAYGGAVNIGGVGYAVGAGQGTATGNIFRGIAWNLSTNTRTFLDTTGLSSSSVNRAGSVGGVAYAVGLGNGSQAAAWNLSTNTRIILENPLTDVVSVATGVASGDGAAYATGVNVFAVDSNAHVRAVAWNLSTGARTILNGTGLADYGSYGAGSVGGVGYAVGYGDGHAVAWDLSTNTRIDLDSFGSYAFGVGSAGGVGYAVGFTGDFDHSHVAAWNLSTSTRVNLESLFLPSGLTSSSAFAMSEDGDIAGKYNMGSGDAAYTLEAFKAWEGDTLDAGKTAKVTGNLTQSSGKTILNGTYEFIGGDGNDTYTLASGGALQGTGTLIGNLNNTGGILAPGNSPGTFTVDGDYVQGADGVLNMEIDSLTDFDVLAVTGDATLGGTLNLSFGPGLSIDTFAAFDILTVEGDLLGNFDQVNLVGGLPDGAIGYYLTTSSGAGGSVLSLTVTAVPESGTLALWGAALPLLGTLALVRRRTRQAVSAG